MDTYALLDKIAQSWGYEDMAHWLASKDGHVDTTFIANVVEDAIQMERSGHGPPST